MYQADPDRVREIDSAPRPDVGLALVLQVSFAPTFMEEHLCLRRAPSAS
jgi:hypothetical protein